MRLVAATNTALDQIEIEPGIGSPVLGNILDIPDLRTWRVEKFHEPAGELISQAAASGARASQRKRH